MLDIIKQAAKEAVEAGAPCAVLFGSITKTDPLEVIVDQRFTLDADFLVIPESLTRFEIDLKHYHSSGSGTTGDALTDKVVIRPGLQQGDKIILLRVQGGQQYLILDKVVSP